MKLQEQKVFKIRLEWFFMGKVLFLDFRAKVGPEWYFLGFMKNWRSELQRLFS